MATQVNDPIPVPATDSIEIEINQAIDSLIFLLNQRRFQLLTSVRDRREGMRAVQAERQSIQQQLEETRAHLEGQMTHNQLHTIHTRIMAEMEAKQAQLQASLPPPQVLVFECDTSQLEYQISQLGVISQVVVPSIPPRAVIPKYAAFHKPTVAVGERGSAAGKFEFPRGVSIETETGHIYVADMKNSRIQIFSEQGDVLNEFGNRHLKNPWGILIYQDNVYITDIECHAVFLYKLPELTMVKKMGKEGSGIGEFNSPKNLAISPNKLIYIADQYNDRLVYLSANLELQGSLVHTAMSEPVDIKFTADEMFVLSWTDSPCIHVFSLSGEKSHSFITREDSVGAQVRRAHFFCLDKCGNILISDSFDNKIKVFSAEGDLLHTIGGYGMFSYPYGIAILRNTKLICVSQHDRASLQIF